MCENISSDVIEVTTTIDRVEKTKVENEPMFFRTYVNFVRKTL